MLGCHSKVPWTGWFKQQKFISHSSEVQDRVSAWPGSGKSPLPSCRLLSYIPTWQKEGKQALYGPLYEGTNPIHEDSTLMTYLFPKAPPPNTITSGFKISTQEFWGDTNIQSIACITDSVLTTSSQRKTAFSREKIAASSPVIQVWRETYGREAMAVRLTASLNPQAPLRVSNPFTEQMQRIGSLYPWPFFTADGTTQIRNTLRQMFSF